MDPTLLSRVPAGPRDGLLVYTLGPADHSHGVLTKGTCDPRWVVWDCVRLTHMGQDHGRPHTNTQLRKRDTT